MSASTTVIAETMRPDPLVSVIIPSYNHGRFLRECIDSVLAQDYPAIEVIVVDDGSTDDSLDILRGYGERITLLQQRGGRQARARNLGLQVARGELVAFLDSDDRYLPGRIASAVAVFRETPAIDVVWGRHRLIDAHGEVLAEPAWSASDADFRRELIAGNPICNGTVTLRRQVLDEIGGFDERVPRVCDGAAWYQIAARGHRFRFIDRPVLDYRVHGSNDSSRFAPMTRDRDTALTAAAQAYVRFRVVAGPADLAWLCGVLLRQYSFRAAAWVQRERGGSWMSRLRAGLYEVLGSDTSLALLGRLQALKNRISKGAPQP